MNDHITQFEECYKCYFRPLLRIAYQVLGNKDDAEDVVQDVFTKLFYCLVYNQDVDDLKRWLYVSTRHRAVDYKRRPKTEMLDNTRLKSQSDVTHVHNRLVIDALFSDLATEHTLWHKALEMQVLLGLSMDEISYVLGCSPHAVRGYLYRARQYLKNHPYSDDILIVLILAMCVQINTL